MYTFIQGNSAVSSTFVIIAIILLPHPEFLDIPCCTFVNKSHTVPHNFPHFVRINVPVINVLSSFLSFPPLV